MHCFLLACLCGLGGLIVGAVFHAVFAAKEATTKKELADFATRLRVAFESEATKSKSELSAVIADIEKKL